MLVLLCTASLKRAESPEFEKAVSLYTRSVLLCCFLNDFFSRLLLQFYWWANTRNQTSLPTFGCIWVKTFNFTCLATYKNLRILFTFILKKNNGYYKKKNPLQYCLSQTTISVWQVTLRFSVTFFCTQFCQLDILLTVWGSPLHMFAMWQLTDGLHWKSTKLL